MGSQTGEASVLLGQPGGTFAAQVPLTVSTFGEGTRALRSSDFDQDGNAELAVLTPSGVQMLWGICR
ncbi:hypothetical protein F0U62_43975 [Cystobacter fuscus]|uniref:hypothetical protein n=1 Tax=Cystobacter fuscus TaxID=43 RepID=UPI002B2F1740|nr:hypothetical protein F0U62_43975 [Cystobacter fuscus]